MPFNLDSLQKYALENNIALKGVIHLGSHNHGIQSMYNTLNIHNNNIIWIESDTAKANFNIKFGIPNCFTTIIDEHKPFINYDNQQQKTLCTLECCVNEPHLVITEVDDNQTRTLTEFFEITNLDPMEFNIWNFDALGSEFRILKSSQNLLKFADIIYTGINSTEITKKNNVESDIDTLLKEHGLIRIETIKNEDNWCMALYIRI